MVGIIFYYFLKPLFTGEYTIYVTNVSRKITFPQWTFCDNIIFVKHELYNTDRSRGGKGSCVAYQNHFPGRSATILFCACFLCKFRDRFPARHRSLVVFGNLKYDICTTFFRNIPKTPVPIIL